MNGASARPVDATTAQKVVQPGDVEVRRGIGGVRRTETRRHRWKPGTMRGEIEQPDFVPRRTRNTGGGNQFADWLIERNDSPFNHRLRAASR